MTTVDPEEYQEQFELLHTGIGLKGSGACRYAAAMYFYNLGLMSAGYLEMYRRCAKFDSEDPTELARYEGVHIDVLPAPVTDQQARR